MLHTVLCTRATERKRLHLCTMHPMRAVPPPVLCCAALPCLHLFALALFLCSHSGFGVLSVHPPHLQKRIEGLRRTLEQAGVSAEPGMLFTAAPKMAFFSSKEIARRWVAGNFSHCSLRTCLWALCLKQSLGELQ
jgi:hypothetical protein